MQQNTHPGAGQVATGVPAGGPVLPSGAARWATKYFEGNDSRQMRSASPVPVNQFGHVVGAFFECPKCKLPLWFPQGLKGVPVCSAHNKRMREAKIKRPSLLPVAAIWSTVERPLRPVWALVGTVGAGLVVAAVDVGPVPALVLAATAPLAGYGAAVVARRGGTARGWLAVDGTSLDDAVRRAARQCGYVTAAGFGWLALDAAVGWGGHHWALDALLWGGLATAWLLPAATWWRRLRIERSRPAPVAAGPVKPSKDELDAAEAERLWRDEVAVAGTQMERGSWKRIPCGWQAQITATKRGALNALGGDFNSATVKRIAAAYDVPFSAITWIEGHEDSPNKALLLVQPSNPLSAGQVWAGPDTVDMVKGVAEAGRLIDGTVMTETLYRYGWGAPSEIVLGTTGGGKSARARKKLIVERWASFEDAKGVRRGAFISILHDPKRMESYAEFRNAIHAYGMTRDDAHIIADALLRECYRRYDFLAGLQWTDSKNRPRQGGLAWNPLVHGPIISHFWDEFHELASDGEFVAKLEKLARLQRACAMRGTLLSHMGTLGDTGSQALRDMLAGGRATLFRTTSALNAGLVTGGQLNADPRTLPRQPGMCYVADGETAAIMGRESYIPGGEEPGNVYDWMFDDANEPIGYPADIPPETAEAFGAEFMEWAAAGRLPGGRPDPVLRKAATQAAPKSDVRCVDAVLAVLASTSETLDRNQLSAQLSARGHEFATRTVNGALDSLCRSEKAVEVNKRFGLTPGTREEFNALARERVVVAAEASE